MDKAWLRFIVLGIVLILIVIGWDVFLTVSGAKETREYNVIEISPDLYGQVEQHLRDDVNFVKFEQEANQQSSSTTTSAGN